MKFKFLKMAVAGLVLTVSGGANATLVNHNGYILDSDKNIVSHGDIEYLQWSLTAGQSIEEALQQYGDDGWSLVSNMLMSNVFSDFGFRSTADESASLYYYGSSQAGTDVQNFDVFLRLFGTTFTNGPVDNPYLLTSAIFGSDINRNGLYNQADVRTTPANIGPGREALAALRSDVSSTANSNSDDLGVALFRVQVSEPATFAIIALGLLVLASRRFKKQS